MRFYWLVIGSLGVWRIVHLFHAEDGPWNLLARLRQMAGSGWAGQLLDCFYCLSLWIADIFAYILGAGWRERLLIWPALSGAAILMERTTSREGRAPPAIYTENEEEEHVLRQEQDTISATNFEHPAS